MLSRSPMGTPLLLAALAWILCIGSCKGCGADKIPAKARLPLKANLPPLNSEVLIPGGSFMMGAVPQDKKARPCERPRHQVSLDPFYLDTYETTVQQYAEAVRAKIGLPEPLSPNKAHEARMCNWLKRQEKPRHPINCVTWTAADAYCRWRGKRLPTEAELEYVLRGGKAGVIYPWGDRTVPPPRTGNYSTKRQEWDREEGDPIKGYAEDGFDLTAPVGSFPATPLGVYDISGNLWEWASDWFGDTYFTKEAVSNPKGAATGERRILKGGNFHCVLEELRISERHHKRPDDVAIYSGFRCARDKRK